MFDTALRIVGNYLIVQTSIVLFVLPFYWLYRRRQPKDGHKLNISRQLEYFFTSTYANYLVFFWAMGEALVWFVIPEFLLLLLIFMRIQRKRELLYYDIYGTAAGTLLAFAIHLPQRFIEMLPYVQPGMVAQVRHWYDIHGILGLAYQPFSGVPYKVFTHLAPNYHFFIPLFLIFAVIVRISRYYFFYVLLTSIYNVLHKFVYRNYVRLFLIGTFIFSVILLRIYTSYGPGYHINLSVSPPSGIYIHK